MPVFLLTLRRARRIILLLGRGVLAEVPDRMDERDLLPAEKQEHEEELEYGVPGHGRRPVYWVSARVGKTGFRPSGCYTGRR